MIATTVIGSLPAAADRASDPSARRLLDADTASTAASDDRILAVELRSRDGRRWTAIGGGPTVAAALEYARESCPDGAIWAVARWNDLYAE